MITKTDILIAGAGAAGLTAGIALARAGCAVAVCGEPETRRNGRTVALFEASLQGFSEDALATRQAQALKAAGLV